MGAIATGAQQTLQVWADYTNAHGGLNGHPVHVFSADDGGDPSTSQTLVEQMVTQDHVIAFIGNQVPLTIDASISYLEQQHIPIIGGDLLGDEWFDTPVLFPEGAQLTTIVDSTVKAAVAAGKTNLGILYCVEVTVCTEQYNRLFNQGGAKADGANPVYSSSYSVTQADFTSQCIAAKQANANVLFLLGDGNSLERLASDCAAQGYNPLYEASTIGVSASMQSDSKLNGMLGSLATFPWMDGVTPAQATYQQAIAEYASGLVGSGASSEEWTSGMLAVAASKYLTATPTSDEFFQGLYSINGNNLGGLTEPLTFSATAKPSVQPCAFYITLQGSKFVDTNNGNYRC